MTPSKPAAPAGARAIRPVQAIPLNAPDDARLFDVARAAAARGLRIAYVGRTVVLTPRQVRS